MKENTKTGFHFFLHLIDINLNYSKETERDITPGRTVLSLLVTTWRTRSTGSRRSHINSSEVISVFLEIMPKSDGFLGFYENGRRHGEGTFHYQNGDSYSGWWKYGQKSGKGTYTYANTGMRVTLKIIYNLPI